MTEFNLDSAFKAGKQKDRPKSKHYVMLFVILIILAVILSVIFLNYTEKGTLNFGVGESPPSFPGESGSSGASSSDSGVSSGDSGADNIAPPPLPPF